MYDASGRKLRKIVTSPDGNYTLDYISGAEFRDGELEAIYHEEGRFYVPKAEEGQEVEDPRYEFFLKDHLGNTRVVIADLDGSGSIDITEDPVTNELLQVGAPRRSRTDAEGREASLLPLRYESGRTLGSTFCTG